MHDSITMADVGSIVNVSGSRMATPFGPPSPGNTPTNTPSSRPSSISESVFHVSSTTKPWSRRLSASIAQDRRPLEAERRFERALRHDEVERDRERHEHQHGKDDPGDQRLPPRDSPDEAHEARDQEEARGVDAEPLRDQHEHECRHEYLQHAAELVARDESIGAFR